jgi:hypothetical protein
MLHPVEQRVAKPVCVAWVNSESGDLAAKRDRQAAEFQAQLHEDLLAQKAVVEAAAQQQHAQLDKEAATVRVAGRAVALQAAAGVATGDSCLPGQPEAKKPAQQLVIFPTGHDAAAAANDDDDEEEEGKLHSVQSSNLCLQPPSRGGI